MKKTTGVLLTLIILSVSCEKKQEDSTLLKFYGSGLEDIAYSISAVNDGFAICGQLTEIVTSGVNIIDNNASIKKLGVIRTGPDGNILWRRNFGNGEGATGSKILALDDGSVVAAGYIIDSVDHKKDIFLVKISEDGLTTTEKIFKAEGNQTASDIIKTDDGFIVLGSTDFLSGTSGKDICLLKLNNNLELIRETPLFGFPGNDEGIVIKKDINGGFIILGNTDNSLPGQTGANIIVIKTNSDLSLTNSKILDNIHEEFAADIEILDDGYLIAANTGTEGAVQKPYIWKLSVSLNIILEHVIETGLTTSVSIKSINKYKTNSYVMAGQSGIGSSARMLVCATDFNGYFTDGSIKVYGGSGIQAANDVITDSLNNIIVVGKSSYENSSMISFLKFRF